MFSELLLLGCLIGVFVGAKKIDDYRAKHPPEEKPPLAQVQSYQTKVEESPADEEERDADEVKSVCRSFGCRFSAGSVKEFCSPDYETAYEIDTKTYVSYRSLTVERRGEVEKPSGFACSRLVRWLDAYGNHAICLTQDVPCFDSGDREYDSAHKLFFFYQGDRIFALYVGEGYRIASMTLYEDVKPLSIRLRSELKQQGFPV